MTSTIAELLRLEQAGWASLRDGTGSEFFGAIMIPEAVMVLADGSVRDRAGVMAALRDSPAWAAFEIDDERVVPMGSDAAALVYTGRAFRAAGGPAFTATMTSVYVRVHGAWRLAVYQQTPIPEAD